MQRKVEEEQAIEEKLHSALDEVWVKSSAD